MCKYICPNKNSYSVGKYLTTLLSLNKNFPDVRSSLTKFSKSKLGFRDWQQHKRKVENVTPWLNQIYHSTRNISYWGNAWKIISDDGDVQLETHWNPSFMMTYVLYKKTKGQDLTIGSKIICYNYNFFTNLHFLKL